MAKKAKTNIKPVDPKKVTSSNQLIESRHPFTLQEMRLFLCLLSEVKPDDPDSRVYRIYMKDFVGDRKDIYSRSRQLTYEFMARVIELKTDTGFKQINFMQYIEYFYTKGYIEFSFTKYIKPHILGLKKRFTSYEIGALLSFRSIFSVRIYQLLKSFQGLKERKMTVENLRTALMVENKFTRWSDFKRYVLEVAKKELRKKSHDVYFSYTLEKRGRSIHAIHFKIHQKCQQAFNFYTQDDGPQLPSFDDVIAEQEFNAEHPPGPYTP